MGTFKRSDRRFSAERRSPKNPSKYDRDHKPERRLTRGGPDSRGEGRESGFRREGAREGGFRDDRREKNFRVGRETALTNVICSSCGRKCSVPFVPTENKPVYCRECFKKPNSRSDDLPRDGPSNELLQEINMKLDMIMQALKVK